MVVPKNTIRFVVRESTGPLDSPLGADLRQLEAKITGSEVTGLEARWEFGRHLLRQRNGEKLANGLLDAIVAEIGISRSEIQYRMQFAEVFPTKDELSKVLDNHKNWWNVIKAMPKSPRKPKNIASPLTSKLKRQRNWLIGEVYEHRAQLTDEDVRELLLIRDAIVEIFEDSGRRGV
jgi:hypothetical protein